MPSFGKRLKRLRRLKFIKQETVASIAGVNQATVSRWESGSITPSPATIAALWKVLAQAPVHDAALLRLVKHSTLPTHLITDIDHRLLAASPLRQKIWGIAETDLLHTSLWPYATEDIAQAELQLETHGWWEQDAPEPVVVNVRTAQTTGLHIQRSTMVWERVWLANGLPARLCTTIQSNA
ncbi:helix-turn-helix transcriptional regulator [Curvibacter sp. CHRR-16]|uniref:helix-turn-helix domain-containing protein n=1 Tax=Curvibacter sp. CHRR-16 TaxID=2835872 RepID=UPI001BD9FE19|nr:helix-turn-helix transcriptional regulator [Curvibacter sp. CHRR-16]MBT0569328.1 helix-turn-helix transcriptional regulator [Curvibacter sp. CHRR-16]